MTNQADLSDDQRRVLQLLYDRFCERGAWPTFGDIDRPLRKQGLRPEAVIEAMPAGLLVPFQAGRLQPIARDEVQLTLRGLAACDGGQQDIDLLLRLLPWLAQRELEFEPLPDVPDLRVPRSEIAAFLQLPVESTGPVTRLRHMLAQQRWAWSGGELADGEWYVQIDRNVYRFAEVKTLDDYLDVLDAWGQEGKRPYVTVPDNFYGQVDGFADMPVLLPESPLYISAAVVADLTAAAATSSSWDCAKLLALIAELNDSYASGKTYASHALLRAILDHVPPLLGCGDFAAVVNNYAWGRTDKQYLRQLATARHVGDDVLHRQISRTADLLTLDDLPPRIALTRLLQECASALSAPDSAPARP